MGPSLNFSTLWGKLPPEDEGLFLVGCFNRHIAWNGSPILEDDLIATTRWLYGLAGSTPKQPNMAFQVLALNFTVLALGSLLNPEVAPDDKTCLNYHRLSQTCLAQGNFLVHNSLTTVQTLSLMAKFTTYVGMRDIAWQIRGMANRIMLAMGLHRDGQSWDLSTKELNNRRRTFWESYSTDVLISTNWDRPAGLSADTFDTLFPDDYHEGSGFEKQRCRLAILAQEALQEGVKIRPNYNRMKEIYHSILRVEAETPFHLRCRAALSVMVSRYSTLAEVEADTPPPPKNLRLAFQSHDLIDVASAIIIFMFRPYFVHATQEADPYMSAYSEAYLAVIERSSMLIANMKSLHSMFPLISIRHWFFWNHTFSGAVSMAIVCMANPGSLLVDLALSELNSFISFYLAVIPNTPPKWVNRNLQWLIEVKGRAHQNIEAFRSGQPAEVISPASVSEETPEYLLLLGWRKRLIELSDKDPTLESEGLYMFDSTSFNFEISDTEIVSVPCSKIPSLTLGCKSRG